MAPRRASVARIPVNPGTDESSSLIGSAIASSTLFVEMFRGRTIEQAKQIKDKDIAEALELPAIKLHCSVLAEEGIHKAIENWEEKLAHRKHNYANSDEGLS